MLKHRGPRRQIGPRKRTGCITCKDAHVRCTEESPHCRRCERLKLDCQYAFRLMWEADDAEKGIVHGRTGVWS
ncbi:hypothetical protein EK21DRAFT_61631 [Setomelanomma holmii]|uniref:Zn(2)-C6 fungal-type domain-containing protein n=1 Tax=Setomelanomma holmii TaxID=210430 RepID=A0A9P4LM11_9PLEO|nr:hypothetical protein EK21DRAFT_61631 [Setomelanomma holmii]